MTEMITADRIESSRIGSDQLHAQSLADLREAFDELAHLSASMRERVVCVRGEIQVASSNLHRPTARAMLDELARMAARLAAFREMALASGSQARRPEWIGRLSDHKAELAEVLRTLITQAAALVVASDWQSPSFAHAVHSSAGRYTGRIREHTDDYKRDRHEDAAEFERAYLREYAGDGGRGLRGLMTNCGMAAFTTILAFLETDRTIDGPVVAGRSTYHECLDLLARSRFRDRLVLVDEARTAEVTGTLERRRPGAVFLDSLCNARGIAVPDLRGVIGTLAQRQDDVYLVIDNSGLSCSIEPFGLIPRTTGPMHVIAFESLTKYAQFGLDRAAAGMIVAPAEDGDGLDARREHLGTNVTDTSVHVIPWPDRPRLNRRLTRLGRNAGLLAARLQAHAESAHGSPLRSVTYPGLPGHPSNALVSSASFQGGFLSLEFEPHHERKEVRWAFLRLSLEEAARRGVPLAAGASFGLNTTRLYVTASNSDPARAFVRISPGTEHLLQVVALGDVFEYALDRLGERVPGA